MAKSTIKVLLVEDSPSDARLVEHELHEDQGYCFDVVWVSRVDEAIAGLKRQQFDVALLDLTLPDSDGLATFSRIQEASPQQLPIIILTGTGNEEIGHEAISLGAQDYLVKGSTYSKSLTRAIRYAIERKQAESQREAALVALGHSEEKFAKAFATNPAAIALTKLEDGLFLEVNDTWVELNGYGRDEVIGRSARKLPIWPTAEAAKRFVDELREKGSVRGWEQAFRNKSGGVFVAQLSAQVLTIQGESVVLTTMVDITSRKLAEEQLAKQAAKLQERTAQLEEINKELESFSYSVSHDLRAPLRAIDGYARMILKKQGDKFNEETKERFNVIRQNVEMMGNLIDDLLNLSRLGKKAMTGVRLDMAGLATDVWNELHVINQERAMELNVTSMPDAFGDKTLIRQVYLNLLTNAVKFAKRCPIANIEAGGYTKGNDIVYYIRDNGAGFDMAYYDKLFGVFQRLHSNEEFEGTGVGLAIVQRIIHRHGGRVWAEGKENKGATFYFSLPQNRSTAGL